MSNTKKYTIVPAKNQTEDASARLQEFEEAYPEGIAYSDRELAEEKARGMSDWLGIKLEVRVK